MVDIEHGIVRQTRAHGSRHEHMMGLGGHNQPKAVTSKWVQLDIANAHLQKTSTAARWRLSPIPFKGGEDGEGDSGGGRQGLARG